MTKSNPTSIERRSFLKGALGIGAAATVAGLAGCAPAKDAKSSGGADASGTAKSSSTPTWENPPAPIDASKVKNTVDADVVIIGAGMAGTSAFMHAAENGAKTVLIEKLEKYSGRGLDFAAVDTKIQKANGIKIDKGRLINDLMKASGYKANGSLLKLWADHSGEVFDRLIDMTEADGGQVVPGMGSTATANAEDFTTRTYPTDHMFGGLVEGPCQLIERMIAAGEKAGGEVVYNMKAEQLEKQGSRITAVYASDKNGEITKYNAKKGVIIATGDYGNNQEMVDAWCPLAGMVEASVYPEAKANTGDGINMAMWQGAAIMPGAHAAMIHPIAGGGALATASYMKVNNAGERFCNENTTLPGISNMYLTNQGHKVYAIFDDDFENQMPKMSPLSNYNNNTAGALTGLFMAGKADPANPPSHTEVVKMCVEEGSTFKADTIADLAKAIEVDPATLEATVARYNELVDKGVDEDYGKNVEDLKPIKKGPFYASKLPAKLLVIASGLNVNGQMQVLDKDDKGIEGLYAVGNVMGNFFANDYPICAPGLSHGRCLTLGALVGKAVAKGTPLGK